MQNVMKTIIKNLENKPVPQSSTTGGAVLKFYQLGDLQKNELKKFVGTWQQQGHSCTYNIQMTDMGFCFTDSDYPGKIFSLDYVNNNQIMIGLNQGHPEGDGVTFTTGNGKKFLIYDNARGDSLVSVRK